MISVGKCFYSVIQDYLFRRLCGGRETVDTAKTSAIGSPPQEPAKHFPTPHEEDKPKEVEFWDLDRLALRIPRLPFPRRMMWMTRAGISSLGVCATSTQQYSTTVGEEAEGMT